MSPLRVGILLLALLFTGPPRVVAQPTAECPTSECAPAAQTTSEASAQLWLDAAAIHRLKLQFVEALQRFTRAQAGTFADEGTDLHLGLASMREALSRWDRAIQQFQVAAARLGRSSEAHVALATVFLDRQRVADTLRELGAAEAQTSRRADVYTLQALAYGVSNRPAQAARALRMAAAINPNDPTIVYALAQHLAQQKRSEEAVQALRDFTRAVPRQGATAKQQATPARFERVDLLRQASGAAPIFPHTRYAEGYAALRTGDYEAAVSRFEEAVAGDPLVAGEPDSRQRVVRAASALREGRVGEALQQLREAVAASPGDSETHRLLGLAYWIDDQQGPSIEHLRSAIRLAPGDERARVGLSDVLAGDRRFAEAERELQQAIDAGARSGQVHYRLSLLYQRQALLPQTTQALRDSEPFGPVVGRDHFYQTLGSLLVNQADFDGAVAAYAQRIDVNPNSGEAHRQLGEIYFLQGRDDEALAEFTAAVWLDPNDARAHAAAGQVLVRMRKYSDAVAALQRAVSIDSGLREARYALGTSLMRIGKVDEAKRELDTFQRLQAEVEALGQREFRLDALRRDASRSLLAGAHDRALVLLQEAVSVDPGSARSHRELGLALMRAQRAREAIEHLEAAQGLEETAEGFRYLADAHVAAGNREEAGRQRALAQALVGRTKLERIRELGR